VCVYEISFGGDRFSLGTKSDAFVTNNCISRTKIVRKRFFCCAARNSATISGRRERFEKGLSVVGRTKSDGQRQSRSRRKCRKSARTTSPFGRVVFVRFGFETPDRLFTIVFLRKKFRNTLSAVATNGSRVRVPKRRRFWAVRCFEFRVKLVRNQRRRLGCSSTLAPSMAAKSFMKSIKYDNGVYIRYGCTAILSPLQHSVSSIAYYGEKVSHFGNVGQIVTVFRAIRKTIVVPSDD